MVRTPSTMARWMGRAATMSATMRGTRYPGSRNVPGWFSPGALFDGCRYPLWNMNRPPRGDSFGSW